MSTKYRSVVVTGACGGIGSAICEVLADEGFRVLGLDKNIPDHVVTSPNKQFRKCDITKLDELEAAFDLVERQLGGADVLVNCAGVANLGHITEVGNKPISDEEIAATMDVNIKAMIFCTRKAVASMKRRGFDGYIININSIAGHYQPLWEDFNIYSSSKHAVTAFTAALANEFAVFGSKIKVTSLSPGLVRSPLSETFIETGPSILPKDIADAVLYLLATPSNVNVTELTIQSVGDKKL